MRIFLALSVAIVLYLMLAYHVALQDLALMGRLALLGAAAGFGLAVSLIPVAGPTLYSQVLSVVEGTLGLALPPLIYTVAVWLSWALTTMSTTFLTMYFIQLKRYIAKRAFRFLLLW
ncbi:hypothetical protein [Thermoproteus tenax]|uniref:hypothetical protein n=1 Tax=Thermoproteus tenax TaxID=2271 RepID=UPI001433418D|nr:hypothetical protein [Thermoproteus tenax]